MPNESRSDDDGHEREGGAGRSAADVTGELLLVGEEASTRMIAESLEADDHRCTCVTEVDAARRCVLERRFDVVLLDLDALSGRAFEVVQIAARLSPATLCVLRSRSATVESVIAAMRAGIGDYFVGALKVPQLRMRIRAAIRRARDAKGGLERVARLASLCRSLVARRGEGGADIDGLAALMDEGLGAIDGFGDGSGGRPDAMDEETARSQETAAPTGAKAAKRGKSGASRPPKASRASKPSISDGTPSAAESSGRAPTFDDVARQQLDPEQLMTAAIEHLVGAHGPLNVAIYLGTGSCRFGLAAYARADLPRASIEVALARWSDEVCTMAAADGRVQVLPEASILFSQGRGEPGDMRNGDAAAEAAARIDLASEELARRAAIVMPCKADGVCDAVFVILAQAEANLRPHAARDLEAFGSSVARQLQRIQRIHSRYRTSWPPESE